jgi:hypothetical protein
LPRPGQPTIWEVVAPKYVEVFEVPVPCQSTCVKYPVISADVPWADQALM